MEANNPKVTVVIASFNAASCIAAALDSVCRLAYDDWECLVIDGASTDTTMSIVRDYAARNPRIRFVSERDNGIYDAFNKGWRLAHGEYIYYLGADDLLYPDCFSKCFAHPSTADIIYGDVAYRTGDVVFQSPTHHQPDRLRRAALCSHQAMLMRRDAIERLGGFDEQYALTADFDLMQRSYLNHCSFEWVDVVFGIHDIGGVSGSYGAEVDCYRVRRNNRSISVVANWLYTTYTFYMRFRSNLVYKLKRAFTK